MVRALTLSTASILVLCTAVAFGQNWGGYSPYGVYNGGHASTAAEGFMNGMGNFVQSAGAYNLQTSQANINNQTAESQYIDNRLKGTQTYFEMRKINRDARKAEETRGLNTEEAWRYAQAMAPKRMTSVQLDPVTGKIYWPMDMMDPRYDGYRKQLDDLFRQRETAHGSVGFDVYASIQKITTDLLSDLKKNIGLYKPDDYIKMKKFVESLAAEAGYPAV
jgi:hypothetical protein